MGLFPAESIKKHLKRKIILDTSAPSTIKLDVDDIYEYNSKMCSIPFTGYSLFWMNKVPPSHSPSSDVYYREKVEEVHRMTNLYPVLHEYAGDKPNGDIGNWVNRPLITDADWSYIPTECNHGAFYSVSGGYAGDMDMVWLLYHTYGITDYHLREEQCNVISTGFSPKDRKWYGWSHRAIRGFGLGDKTPQCCFYMEENFCKYAPKKEGYCRTDCEVCRHDILEPGIIITDMNMARLAACEFAESVS